jgi:hypothetical protein
MERSTLAAGKSQEPRLEAALDALYRVQFGWMDILRRIQGNAAAAIGFSPRECPYQIIASAPHWRLRDYGGQESAAVSLLVVAGPIKRPYIWDLTPSRSAICYCLQQDLHVYLLEWMPATQLTSNNGIDEITLAISNCVAKISARSGRSKPFLVGHSLGGTLAFALTPLATADPCGPHKELTRHLADHYSERHRGRGLTRDGRLLEILISEKGTWTVLVSLPTGLSCIVFEGTDWQGQEPSSGP